MDSVSGNGSIPAYVDDYSSRELSRPSLNTALGYLERAGYDVLIVHSLDRLARDPYIRQTLEREFNSRGARVEFILGNYEESPEGEVRKDLDATFAKWENAKRVERSSRGKKRKAQSGRFVGGRAPFGYQIDSNSYGGLAVVEGEAKIVHLIFQLFVEEGYSLRQIAQLLTEEGIKPQLDGDRWGKSSIPKILHNTVYTGYCYYNKFKRDGNKLIMRDRSEWIRIEVTPIIDDWLFDEAQRRLEENHMTMRVQPKRFYLLTGMVFCTECERPYFTQTKPAGKNRQINDAQTYRHRAKEGHCTNRTVSARRLEPIVWDEVVRILLDPGKLREGYEGSLEQQEQTRARHKSHMETLQRQLVKLEKEQTNLTEIYVDPDIQMTKGEYLEQKARIEAEKASVIRELDQLKEELQNLPTIADLETLEIFAKKIRNRLDGNYDPTPEEKRKILDLLHAKIWIGNDGRVTVSGWFDVDERDSSCLSSTTR